jgi:hypothetical protein
MAVFSPFCVLGSVVEDQLAIDVWDYVGVFYSSPLVFMSVFVPVPCNFYCYISVVLLRESQAELQDTEEV